MRFNTMLLHGTAADAYAHGSTLPPISQTNAFFCDTAEQMEKICRNRAPGYAYTRIGNPTINAFEKRINELEGGSGAVACASGMAAVTAALLNILQAGDEIIAGSGLFGGTIDLFEELRAFGITTRFVRHICPETVLPLITEKTKVIFGEIIGNPGLDVIDISTVAAAVHEKGLPLFLDSTTATPYLVRPLKLGADVIIHSTSKYINGSGNAIGGVIIDGGSFPWDFERYPGMREYRRFGKLAYLSKMRDGLWRNTGACMAPMNAWLNVVGMETMGLRMERIFSNAEKLAVHLDRRGGVKVHYPFLEESGYRELCERQFGGMGGGILTLRAGSKELAFRLLNTLKYAVNATNIGDVRTLILHPASTIYAHSSEEQKEAAGVYEDTIRVSVGIEDIRDLEEDFDRALDVLS